MKHLKRFNEGVIHPTEGIAETLHKICFFTENITLDKINLEFKPLNIEFVDVAKFTEELKTETEKKGVPKNLHIMCGIKFAGVNGYKKMIYLCVEPIPFIDAINNKSTMKQMYPLLLEILRHESVHLQQIIKAKKDFYNSDSGIPNSLYDLKRSPVSNNKEYFSHKTEVMAYAQSFIDQCHQKSILDEDILAALKGKKNNFVDSKYLLRNGRRNKSTIYEKCLFISKKEINKKRGNCLFFYFKSFKLVNGE